MLFPQPRNATYAFEAVVSVLKVVQHSLFGLNVEFDSWNLVFNIVSDIAIVMSTQFMIMLAIERSYAMWTVITYEDSDSALLAFFLSFIMARLWDWLCQFKVVFIVSYTVMLVSCVIFIFFPIACKRAHRTVSHARYATVAQRFRASRNVKAARLLMYLSPYKCVTNLFSLCLYICVFQNTDPLLIPLFSEFYFYYHVAQCFLFMVLTTVLHDSLRETLVQEINLQIKIPGEKETPKEILSVDGQKMMFPAKEEGRIYFDQLALDWGTSIDHRRWGAQQRRIHNDRQNHQSRPKTQSVSPPLPPIQPEEGNRGETRVRFEMVSTTDRQSQEETPNQSLSSASIQEKQRSNVRDDPIITPMLEKYDTIAEEDSLGGLPSSRATNRKNEAQDLRDLHSTRMQRYHRQTTMTMSFDVAPKGDLFPRNESDKKKRIESPWGKDLLQSLPKRKRSRRRIFQTIKMPTIDD
ncbi:unnamed protein product, partial [Mesorhabditis belari]|uniref:Uncharacterized protein n=1 Tax=Mesorhabditis belari TaxID=2138241 RepID=A0AAF3F1H2_9BILA